MSNENEIPRRIDRQRWTNAERAIQDAVDAVEAAGADPLLTDAVILLAEAREKVADFVDGPDDQRVKFRRENPMVLRQEPRARSSWRGGFYEEVFEEGPGPDVDSEASR